MDATFRPLEDWPKEGFEPHRSRERSRFDSHWQTTLDLLRYELVRLGADAVVVKLALGDRDIRRDGYPKANARPDHPGVVVEWQIGEAWYRRAAEKYDRWQDNIRAVALTLEALRAVERWGAVSGEQYEGFRLELEAASGPASSPEWEAARLIANAGGYEKHEDILLVKDDPDFRISCYRRAAKRLHPDAGGDPEEFRKLQEARDVLLGGGS